MSHDSEPQTPAEHGADVDGHQSAKDPFLAILVKTINEGPGWEIGVTLHVNGLIISGLMCSMKSFFEEQAELIRQLGPAEAGWFAEVFDWLAEQTQLPSTEHAGEDGEAAETEAAVADLPDFIHLRAASVHTPGTTAVLPETLWRGRLEHVSGWSIGNFGPKPPPRSRAATP